LWISLQLFVQHIARQVVVSAVWARAHKTAVCTWNAGWCHVVTSSVAFIILFTRSSSHCVVASMDLLLPPKKEAMWHSLFVRPSVRLSVCLSVCVAVC